MKKLFLVLLTAFLVGLVPAVADSDTYSKPGSLTAQAGLGLYWGAGFEILGGVDYGITQFQLAPVFPLDVGASGRLGIGTWGGLAAGAYGTAHYSWKALNLGIDWVNKLETYLGVGIQVLPGIGIDGYSGTSYHFDKNLAIFVEGGVYGSVVGASYKF